MLATSEKLFYCRFGDMLAIPVIMGLAGGLKTRKKELAIDHATSADGISIWQGELTLKARPGFRCRLTMAIVPPDADNVDSFFTDIEIPSHNRVLVVGKGSRFPGGAEGLLKIYPTSQAEVHLRDYQRYVIEGYERDVAVRLLDVFVLRRTPVVRTPEPKTRIRPKRGCYLVRVPEPQFAAV